MRLKAKDGTVLGRLPQESEGLGPLVCEGVSIGSVDEVNGTGALLVPDFTPTSAELVALYRHWWRETNLRAFHCFYYEQSGSTEIRLIPFGRRRMDTIEPLITPESVAEIHVTELADLWEGGHKGEPFDVEEILAVSDGATRLVVPKDEHDRPLPPEAHPDERLWFRGWQRLILDAVAGEVRARLAVDPCDCGKANCRDEDASAFVRKDRKVGCLEGECVLHMEAGQLHTCEEVAAKEERERTLETLVKLSGSYRT